MTQTMIVHVCQLAACPRVLTRCFQQMIRTEKIPFIQSWAVSASVVLSSLRNLSEVAGLAGAAADCDDDHPLRHRLHDPQRSLCRQYALRLQFYASSLNAFDGCLQTRLV